MFDGSTHSVADSRAPWRGDGVAALLEPARIGLFDSGVGGLSVLRALQQRLPGMDYVYCGDTARLPYGKRKPETIVQYSLQASRFLIESGVDTIVVACNTASAVSLEPMRRAFPKIVINGVIEAGAKAAAEATRTGRVAVIGTECTVASRAYESAISRLAPSAIVRSHACPFLVALAEEGWTEGEIAESVIKTYIAPLFATFGHSRPDTLILGCTHYSRFSEIIQAVAGPDVTLIDPADHLARDLSARYPAHDQAAAHRKGTTRFHATDALHRFARVGELFLGEAIPTHSLQRITLDNH